MNEILKKNLTSHLHVFGNLKSINQEISNAAQVIIDALKNGNKLIVFGNGGSAADAQHFVAELTGRYLKERAPLAGIALSTNTSALTAIGNDYGYNQTFLRQAKALAKPGDILFGISTSGQSKNVLNTLSFAKDQGLKAIGLSGKDGGKMNEICDINIVIKSEETPRIQEGHIFVIHTLCEIIENEF